MMISLIRSQGFTFYCIFADNTSGMFVCEGFLIAKSLSPIYIFNKHFLKPVLFKILVFDIVLAHFLNFFSFFF